MTKRLVPSSTSNTRNLIMIKIESFRAQCLSFTKNVGQTSAVQNLHELQIVKSCPARIDGLAQQYELRTASYGKFSVAWQETKPTLEKIFNYFSNKRTVMQALIQFQKNYQTKWANCLDCIHLLQNKWLASNKSSSSLVSVLDIVKDLPILPPGGAFALTIFSKLYCHMKANKFADQINIFSQLLPTHKNGQLMQIGYDFIEDVSITATLGIAEHINKCFEKNDRINIEAIVEKAFKCSLNALLKLPKEARERIYCHLHAKDRLITMINPIYNAVTTAFH